MCFLAAIVVVFVVVTVVVVVVVVDYFALFGAPAWLSSRVTRLGIDWTLIGSCPTEHPKLDGCGFGRWWGFAVLRSTPY